MGTAPDAGITLVLAAYNHERYLVDALNSVAEQDYPGLRLIVTDDASRDGSRDLIGRELARHGLHATTIFHTRNAGVCATFNEALARVKTPFVAFISADDWMEPHRFSRQVQVLLAAPEAAMVYSDVWVVPENEPRYLLSSYFGERWPAGDHRDLLLQLVKNNWIPAPAALSRTDALISVGGYDEGLPYEDWDMWLRLAAHGYQFGYVDEPLAHWRRTSTTMSLALGTETQLTQDLLDLRILSKQLGASAEVDAWLVPFVFHLAVTCHKRGSASPVVARALRTCLAKQPSLASARFATLATLRQRRVRSARA